MQSHHDPADITVMLLAAGHGKRMLPLTKHTPKPLLKIGRYSLIEHHLRRLAEHGFKRIIINIAYLGEQIKNLLKDGAQFGLNITYSDESKTGALETAGGIRNALPLLKSDPFLVINADIYTDFPFDSLLTTLSTKARLVMVENPEHNAKGDFTVNDQQLIHKKNDSPYKSYTFSGIALYDQIVFSNLEDGKQALLPVFNALIDEQQAEALIYNGQWTDVGTPERLEQLNDV